MGGGEYFIVKYSPQGEYFIMKYLPWGEYFIIKYAPLGMTIHNSSTGVDILLSNIHVMVGSLFSKI